MSVRMLDRVLRFSASKGAARLVLIALADVANDEGEVSAYKRSQSILAAKANVDAATVRRAIAALVDLGEVEVLARGDGRRSSDYRIHLHEGVQDASPREGVRDASPGGASRLPRACNLPTQGVQDDTPIIPSSTVPPPSSPQPTLLPADAGAVPASPGLAAAAFEEWWAEFPSDRRTGKGDARKAYAAALKRASASQLLEGVRRYATETRSWPASDRRFIKTPGPWLRSDRWLDEPGANLRRGGRPVVVDDRSAPSGRVSMEDL